MSAWPVGSPPVVSSPFGRLRESRYHMGVDLALPRGTVLVPNLAPGWVRKNGLDPRGFGNYVEFSTGYWVVLLGHLDEWNPITIGNTGRSTGPHLHLEVKFSLRALPGAERAGWVYIDPLLVPWVWPMLGLTRPTQGLGPLPAIVRERTQIHETRS